MTYRDVIGQSSGYFNPGGSGEFSRTVKTLDRSLFATRGDLVAGVDSLFRPNARGTLSVQVSISGLRVVALHAHTIDIMIPGAIGTIHAVTGDYTTAEAQRSIDQDFIKRPYLSGDTYRSIHPRLETTPTTTKTTVGPTTFYAPLIEFGLARHFTYGPRPFMSIAFATVVPHHVAALRQLAQVAAGPRKTISENPHSGPVNEWIRKFRAGLYDIEKRLGDLVPLGGLPFLRAPREATLGAARVLGDIQAVLGRTVSSRIQARLIGKVTGRLIGIGANTIVAHRTVNTDFGVGQRIYNREAGKYLSRYVSQSRLFRGGR